MGKKYFWLKLKTNFFKTKEMKKLRQIAGGDTYTIIYLKMQLLSVDHDGVIYFENVEDNFAEELALELDESEDNVKLTLMFLEKHGLIEQISDESYLLPKVVESIGSETDSAERVRRLRNKNKGKSLHCNATVTTSNTEIEKEKEIERDIEIEQQQTVDVFALYQSEIGILSPLISDRLNEWLITSGDELVSHAIALSVKNNARRLAYIEAILKAWNDKGIKTVADAEAIDVQRKAKPQKPKVEPASKKDPVSEEDYLEVLRKHGLEESNVT
jgi:predicted phage replisome organizer